MKRYKAEIFPSPFFSPPSLSIPLSSSFSCVAHLEFGGWRYRGHKSHCYWGGYEPQPNGDDSARSFSSAFPLQRWALDTVHLTCHFPALHSAICTEPIRTRGTFNFICSSTLQGVFPLQWPLSGTMQLTLMCNITLTFSWSASMLSPLPFIFLQGHISTCLFVY